MARYQPKVALLVSFIGGYLGSESEMMILRNCWSKALNQLAYWGYICVYKGKFIKGVLDYFLFINLNVFNKFFFIIINFKTIFWLVTP